MATLPAYLFASSSDHDGVHTRAQYAARDAESVGLAIRLHDSDEQALEAIIRLYRAPLATFVTRVARLGPEDVDDILQRVFFGLWTHRATIDATTSLRAYLFTAARNYALNHVRDTRRERAQLPIEEANLPPIAAADDELDANDLAAAIHRAIDALPPRCREIFLLSREGGLSYPEIAATIGVSVNTVKTQMTRALAALARAAEPFLT